MTLDLMSPTHIIRSRQYFKAINGHVIILQNSYPKMAQSASLLVVLQATSFNRKGLARETGLLVCAGFRDDCKW